MSTIKQITELRHQGELEEAYQLAKEMQEEEPGIWADRAMFWVLYDMALKDISVNTEESMAKAREYHSRMEELLSNINDDSQIEIKAVNRIGDSLNPHFQILKKLGGLSKTDPVSAYEQAVSIAGRHGEKLPNDSLDDFGWILFRYIKQQANQLSLSDVNEVLNDYLHMNNERPSLLHSTMLNMALSASRQYPDWDFPTFLKQWGLSNFRDEDMMDNQFEGKIYPSLFTRVCTQLALSDNNMVDELSSYTDKPVSFIADIERKPWFWQLYDLHKNKQITDFWAKIGSYGQKFGNFPASKWHSGILRLSLMNTNENHYEDFIQFMYTCRVAGVRSEDWRKEIGTDGKEYPPLAVNLAKKFYDCVKAVQSYRNDKAVMGALANFYDEMSAHKADDEWTPRERAIISIWSGQTEDALKRYREIIKTMGDKYYIWQEIARLTEDQNIRLGCLLHALELEKTEDLIGPLRLQTAEALINIGYSSEARKYLDAYAKNRQKQGKTCPNYWNILDKRAVNGENSCKQTFDARSTVNDAIDYVYSDYPWIQFVLIDRPMVMDKRRQKNRQMLTFTDGKYFFLVSPRRYGLPMDAKLGTIINVRCKTEVNNKRAIPLVIRITDETNEHLVKKVGGWLKLTFKHSMEEADFGFVDNVYVHRTLLKKSGIKESCEIEGLAAIGTNGKWQLIKLKKI